MEALAYHWSADEKRRRYELEFPETPQIFIKRLNEEIDRCASDAEGSALHLKGANEEAITKLCFVAPLKRLTYRVAAEPDSNGHVDITVQDRRERFSWLGEAKKDTGYTVIRDGVKQLVDRYSTGREEQCGLLTYVIEHRTAEFMSTLRGKLPGYDGLGIEEIVDDVPPTPVSFRTKHMHPRRAVPFEIRFIGVTLLPPGQTPKGVQGHKEEE